MSAVEYFRVGVRTHAILLAEDLLSASHLETGQPWRFFGLSHSRMGATKHDGHRAGQRPDLGAGRAWARIWALRDPLCQLPEGTER